MTLDEAINYVAQCCNAVQANWETHLKVQEALSLVVSAARENDTRQAAERYTAAQSAHEATPVESTLGN